MKLYQEITVEIRKTICDLYSRGYSIDEIVTIVDTCKDLVYQILFEENIITEKGKYKPTYKNRSYEWKKAVADYYMNHSRFQTKDFFRTSDVCVDRVIDEFNLPRRTHAEELQFFKIQQFGSIDAYRKHMIQKSRETSIKRYGVDNFAKSDLFLKKSKSTFLQNYGVSNPMKAESVKIKLSECCQNKFGVAWPCMRSEARIMSTSNSKPNIAFYNELVSSIDPQLVTREFSLDKYSYDFKVGNNLIEIDPCSTHNSTWGIFNGSPTDSEYHYKKSETARKHGYRCIHVWDWDKYSTIISLLTNNRKKISARKCIIQEVSKNQEKVFLTQYHIQGYAKSSICFGLFFDNKLVSLMSFDKPRYNKNYQYELVRYCSSCDVIGGVEKLFSYFQKTYHPQSIISYFYFSKFNGTTYEKLGFTFKGVSIGKHWFNMKTGKHITDNLLRQRGFDQLLGSTYGCYGKGTSNEQLMRQHDFVEIYDAGQATYVWNLS